MHLEEGGLRLVVRGSSATIAALHDFDIRSESLAEHFLQQAVASGALHIEIDLCGAGFAGGEAVRLALKAHEAVHPRGGTVTVTAHAQALRLFDVTGTASRFRLKRCA